jgi:hypothetical protein
MMAAELSRLQFLRKGSLMAASPIPKLARFAADKIYG